MTNRHNFRDGLARLAFGVLMSVQIHGAVQRPNILFIMSDDHTTQAVGASATLLKGLDPTPTIDSLAAEGITFDNAFCGNAICTPSRASILTGQYNHINGVFDLGGRVPPEKQTLPIRMRHAGYQTAMIGKWHLKVEPNFDYYKVLPGQGSYFNPGDDGSHYPECEKVVQEFWDYDEADRRKAIEISRRFLEDRLSELRRTGKIP